MENGKWYGFYNHGEYQYRSKNYNIWLQALIPLIFIFKNLNEHRP